MAIEVAEDPFADRVSTSLDEGTVRSVAGSMPDTKVQDLLRAANNERWDKQEGVNEKWLFDKELLSIASVASAELGPFTLDAYEAGQSVIAAGALELINTGDRTGSFRGQNARGGSQWDMQQLTVEALNDTSTFNNPEQARVYSTGAVGNFNIAPSLSNGSQTDERNPSNDSSSNVGSNGDGTHSLDSNTQSAFILGVSASTNPRVASQVKVDVDDGEERGSFDTFVTHTVGSLQTQDAPSLEYITDDDAFDINGTATQNATTDLYPFGVNLNTAANLPGLNTKA